MKKITNESHVIHFFCLHAINHFFIFAYFFHTSTRVFQWQNEQEISQYTHEPATFTGPVRGEVKESKFRPYPRNAQKFIYFSDFLAVDTFEERRPPFFAVEHT